MAVSQNMRIFHYHLSNFASLARQLFLLTLYLTSVRANQLSEKY